MDLLTIPTDHRLINQTRNHSCPAIDTLHISDPVRRRRAISMADVHSTTTHDPSLELLFRITDIVLVICAVIFVISSIASIVCWMYGLVKVYGLSWGCVIPCNKKCPQKEND